MATRVATNTQKGVKKGSILQDSHCIFIPLLQYDKDLIEVWDEAKRLRCEWYNDYEKGVTKPPIRVSDLEVVELNFRGDNVDCWMEIQQGKGPWASPVTGIVPLGTTLTMVVGIDDKQGEQRRCMSIRDRKKARASFKS